MQHKNNIELKTLHYEEIIKICNQHPTDEEMLIIKAKSLKKLKKQYKYIECLKDLLKINPQNIEALMEISYLINKNNTLNPTNHNVEK